MVCCAEPTLALKKMKAEMDPGSETGGDARVLLL
jgi:hypothetical protein